MVAELIVQARDLLGNPRTDNGDADAAYTDGRSSLAYLASFYIVSVCASRRTPM